MARDVDLTDVRWNQDELGYTSGWGSDRARSLIDRYRMAPFIAGRAKARGGPRLYSQADVFALAEAKALVDEGGLTIAAACEAAGQGHGWLQHLVNGEIRAFSKYRGVFRPVGSDLNSLIPRRAVIIVRPDQVWAEMRGRCAELRPKETLLFELRLAEKQREVAERAAKPDGTGDE